METAAVRIKTELRFAREELPHVLLEREERKDFFFWGGGLENFVVVAPGPRKENCRGQRNRALSDS